MGSVEVLPDALVKSQGTVVLGGGAGSVLTALNDGLDTTYIRNGGSMTSRYAATFRFAVPSLPAGAVVKAIGFHFRYSHAKYLPQTEMIQPETILIGRPQAASVTAVRFYTFTVGENISLWSDSTVVQDWVMPGRRQGYDGQYLGKLLRDSSLNRIYASIVTFSNTAWNTARLYSLALIVYYNEAPTVTLVEPSGTVNSSRPPVLWNFSDPDNDKQIYFHARYFTAAQVAAQGFNPATTTPYVGEDVWSEKPLWTPKKGLAPNGTWSAYVRAGQLNVSGVQVLSPWASQSFTLTVISPAAPTLTATYQSTPNAILVTTQGVENMLSWLHSSFENATVTGITLDASTTGASTQTATAEPDGTWSYQLGRSGTTGTAGMTLPADVTTGVDASTYGVPATVGRTYQARAKFRAAVTPRTVQVRINWYTATGAANGNTTFGSATNTTAGWTEVTSSGVAPAGTAWAKVRIEVLAVVVGEVQYVDTVGLFPSTVGAWSRGGFAGAQEYQLQRSLDAGVTWADVPKSKYTVNLYDQTITYYDHEVPSAATGTYRVKVSAENELGDPVGSDWSATDSEPMPAFTAMWLRDLSSNPPLAMALRTADIKLTDTKNQTVGYPLDGTAAVVSHDGVKEGPISLTVYLDVQPGATTEYDTFRAMIRSGRTLFLQDLDGQQWFVQSQDGTGYERMRIGNQGTPGRTKKAYKATVVFTPVVGPSS